ncbi:MAG: hypothetical protein EP348_00185 [Alphaproteobacteria bacterium]|nr:MAG: hypothetical protein EP348_00185 [Alphaproteobacteria bacterium]
MFDFPITLADLTEVPDVYRPLYAAREGEDGFALDPDLAGLLDVSGLTSALEKERSAHQAATRELKAWRELGEDPAMVADILTRAAERESEQRTALEATAREKDAEIARLKESNAAFFITTRANEVLMKAGGVAELLMPHLKSRLTVTEEAGAPVLRVIADDGSLRETETGAPVTLEQLVGEMRASPIFARAFVPSRASGSGMDPAARPAGQNLNSRNPYALTARIEDIATGKVAVTL